MVNTKLKVVIFDLDGVLIDSEALMRAAFETTYHQILGKKTPPTEAYLEHMGESFPQIMDCLGLPHAFWEPYRQFCQREVARIKLFPESCALLRDLHTLGLRLAILTGKDHKRTIQVLEHFDLNGF